MKNIATKFMILILVLVSFSACGNKHKHEHVFSKATCTEDSVCVCGEVSKEALGHDYSKADCVNEEKCSRCGNIQGFPLGHNFSPATYEKPRTCEICGLTEGDKLYLSSTCDKVLATGVDADGNKYELVANEGEDYSGTTISVGVIKNNVWLKEMSSSHPFVSENGLLKGNLSFKDYFIVKYIGNGCFIFLDIFGREAVVYNCINSKSFDKSDALGDIFTEFAIDYEEADCNNRGEYLVFRDDFKDDVYALNTTTMKCTKLKISAKNISAYNEGLFAIEKSYGKGFEFCNINGDTVIKLNYSIFKEDVYDYQVLVFNKGLCTIKIRNDQDSIYEIIIDKSGKVISSIKIE